jgi:hypothetical protein
MTVSKAKPQKTKQDGINDLQSYLTSLLYLRQEAKRDGLDVVAEIMWNALVAIEKWLDTGKAPVNSRDVLDSPLCHSLDFLINWLALPPARQRQAVQDIARFDVGISASEAVPQPRPGASKKIAN